MRILVTACNAGYFDACKTQVASVHRHSIDTVDEYWVFNLGLNGRQVHELEGMAKVKVKTLVDEQDQPIPIQIDTYRWKIDIWYQLLRAVSAETKEEEGPTLVFYLDAGARMMGDLAEVFDLIQKNDVFFVQDTPAQRNHMWTHSTSVTVLQASPRELQGVQLCAGIMGFKLMSSRALHLISEAYGYSRFAQCIEGSRANHRHDQSIWSILKERYQMPTFPVERYGSWDLKLHPNPLIHVHRRTVSDPSGLLSRPQHELAQLSRKTQSVVVQLVDGGQFFCGVAERLIQKMFRAGVKGAAPSLKIEWLQGPDVSRRIDVLLTSCFGQRHRTVLQQRRGQTYLKWFIVGELPSRWEWKNVIQDMDFALTCTDVPGASYMPFYVMSSWDRKHHKWYDLLRSRAKPPVSREQWQRKKFMAFLASNTSEPRETLFQLISTRYKPVDALGERMNRDPKFRSTDRYQDPPGLTVYDTATAKYADYKFVLSCENSQVPKYCTEKPMNALLADGSPILVYWGAPDMAQYFNTNAFILANDRSKWDQVVEQIKRLDQDYDAYHTMLAQPPLLPQHYHWFVES